jgi:serine/threonine protein phosphatase PrpC
MNFAAEGAIKQLGRPTSKTHSKLAGPATADRATFLSMGTQSAIGTATGRVRDENQDRAAILRATFSRSPALNFTIAAICDGIGGMSRGADAAALGLSAFAARLIRSKEPASQNRLLSAVMAADAAVYSELLGRGGTTLSAVLVDSTNCLFGASVGDSGIYELRKQNELLQLSTDDTLAGQINRANIDHPMDLKEDERPELRHLVQYIGMGKEMEPHILPVHRSTELKMIILTSDGAHGAHPETFGEIVRTSQSARDVVDRLLTVSEWLGGRDNATAIAIEAKDFEEVSIYPKSDAAIIEMWSPFGKLEMWGPSMINCGYDTLDTQILEPGIASQSVPPDFSATGVVGTRGVAGNRPVRTQHRSRPGKHRSKSRSRSDSTTRLHPDDPSKPQLDINFSSVKRSYDDPENS